MSKKIGLQIFFIFIIIQIFLSCKVRTEKISFSFEQLQEFYNEEISKANSKNICPFYINESFFSNIEKQLNELIVESDYCSLLICVNIDNGLLDVRALYNKKNKIYFKIWKYDGRQYQIEVRNQSAKKILKSRPKDLVIIEDSNLPIADGTSTYIIKKIGKETYCYASYYESTDINYTLLRDLFRKNYENVLEKNNW